MKMTVDSMHPDCLGVKLDGQQVLCVEADDEAGYVIAVAVSSR